MTARTATMTVTAPCGDSWLVTYRPSIQRKRVGLGGNASGVDASRYVTGILATYAAEDGTVRCAACGGTCGIGRGTVRRNGDVLAAAEGDRAAADLAGWSFDGPAVPYSEATVLPVCPVHNGDAGARAALTDAQRAALDAATRSALDAHASRLR